MMKNTFNSELPNQSKIEEVRNLAESLQETMETMFKNSLSGGCYLFGHCLTEILNKKGFKARTVSGKLALHIKNTKDKYAKYGPINLKGQFIGNYHTWCEVVVNNEKYIIDPSLKYNKLALKESFSIKVNNKIPCLLLTKNANTFTHKYLEDNKFKSQSMSFLNKISVKIKNEIILKTIEKQNVIFRNAS